MATRFFAVALISTAALVQLGCSSDGGSIGAADEPFTATASGLWALDGDAEHGDIELLQIDRRSFASVLREDPSPAPTAARQMAESDEAPPPDTRTATGNLARVGRAATAKVSLVANDQKFTVKENGDTLTLTTEDGRELTYRRTYRLYCVATDRSIEATALVELGKEPKLVGVNGDGRVFPKAGSYDAAIQNDVLLRLHEYVITATTGASTITVKLPWSDMSKAEIEGTLAITGMPSSAPPTPIACERVPATN